MLKRGERERWTMLKRREGERRAKGRDCAQFLLVPWCVLVPLCVCNAVRCLVMPVGVC